MNDYFIREHVLIVAVCLFQRVLVANTDVLVGRIQSRLDAVNTTHLQSEQN